MVRCDMVFDMDYGLTPYTPQNIKNMDYYRKFKENNIKFPMTKEMFDYYFSLGLDCFVIKYNCRMDGSIYAAPGILSPKYNVLDCICYNFMDRQDIRTFLLGWDYSYFREKYEKRCKEIFKKRMYSDSPNSING